MCKHGFYRDYNSINHKQSIPKNHKNVVKYCFSSCFIKDKKLYLCRKNNLNRLKGYNPINTSKGT